MKKFFLQLFYKITYSFVTLNDIRKKKDQFIAKQLFCETAI